MMKPEGRRSTYEKLRGQLDMERSSFMSHWRELGDFIEPRRPRFTVTDNNRGDRRNQRIIDSTATIAARTLASGMTSGITSPARPWFKLTSNRPDQQESPAVKSWLYEVQTRMYAVANKSNLYEVLPPLYGDMSVFGTGCILAEEDFDTVVRFYQIPIGSYYIANDQRGRVGVFMRQFRMTVRQLVDKFGGGDINGGQFSSLVRTAWEQGQKESWVEVAHLIQPNENYDQSKAHSKFKKYSSCYYERSLSNAAGQSGRDVPAEEDVFLRESGYDNFPVFASRWMRNGTDDVYGTNSPGMVCLGDVKALQLMHRRKSQAIEKMVNPPLMAPESMRSQKLTILPGEVNYLDVREGMQGIKPVHDVNFRIQELNEDIRAHQERIREAFFADLFLMMSQDDRNQRATATEINERREEKLLVLGPVMENVESDVLQPLIDLLYIFMDRQGLIPPAPEELQGVELKVEFVSVMAQAQKLVSVGSLERFQGYALQQAQFDPQVTDVVDSAAMLAAYGDVISLQPGIVRPAADVAAIRANRAQQEQAAQQAQMAPQLAQAANSLANAPMDGKNALTELLGTSQAGALSPAA